MVIKFQVEPGLSNPVAPCKIIASIFCELPENGSLISDGAGPSKYTLVRVGIATNELSMLVTLAGMLILVSLDPTKAELPMVVRLLLGANVTVSIELYENAPKSMICMLAGIKTDVIFDCENA